MKEFLLQIFTWWNSQTIGTRFFTWRRGKRVGEDALGNIYYREKDGDRRWVIYNGVADASGITAAWHAWMHHRSDTPPANGGIELDYEWEKPYKPNMTGTAQAYRPPGSILTPEKRPDVTGDYDAWTP